VVTPSGVTSGAWVNHAVTLDLSAVDEAGGSGVASITTVIGAGPQQLVPGDVALVALPVNAATHADDGSHSLSFFATDYAGNAGTTQNVVVKVDTRKPVPKAPTKYAVSRNHKVALRCRVNDAGFNGGTATVVITIKSAKGKTLKTFKVGVKKVNAWFNYSVKAAFPRGTYRYYVSAVDRAGNAQAARAVNRLVVR